MCDDSSHTWFGPSVCVARGQGVALAGAQVGAATRPPLLARRARVHEDGQRTLEGRPALDAYVSRAIASPMIL